MIDGAAAQYECQTYETRSHTDSNCRSSVAEYTYCGPQADVIDAPYSLRGGAIENTQCMSGHCSKDRDPYSSAVASTEATDS